MSTAAQANLSSCAQARPTWLIDAAGLLICAAASMAAYFVTVAPILSSQDNVAATQAQVAAKHQQANELAATSRSLQVELKKANELLKQNSIELQPSAEENRRVASITQSIEASGLEVRLIHTGALAPGPQYGQMPIHLTAAGGFRSIAALLRGLHDSFPDTAVSNFRLSSNNLAANASSAQFDVDLTWYVQPSSGLSPRADGR
jgi:Tfp pilus assembly protein PilO